MSRDEEDLGYRRVRRDRRTGELTVYMDSADPPGRDREELEGEDEDERDFGEEDELEEEDELGDDDELGEEDEDEDGVAVSGRRGRRRRRGGRKGGRRGRRSGRRTGRKSRRRTEREEPVSVSRHHSKVTWGSTVVGGAGSADAAGPVTVQIRLQHAFRARDITFDGSVAGARVNTIFFGAHPVWSSPSGIPVASFTASGALPSGCRPRLEPPARWRASVSRRRCRPRWKWLVFQHILRRLTHLPGPRRCSRPCTPSCVLHSRLGWNRLILRAFFARHSRHLSTIIDLRLGTGGQA